jgi:hypothetical protein
MKKLITILSLLIFMTVTLTTCDLINDLLEEDDDTSEIKGTYEMNLNPGDPTLLKSTNEDGSVFTFFGTKDFEGAAEKVDIIDIQYPGESGTYKMMVRDDGTPGKIFTPEGSTFEFEPISEKEFYLSIASKTGEIRISTKVNLDSLEKMMEAVSQPLSIAQNDVRRNQAPPALFTPSSTVESTWPSGTLKGNKLILNLTSCGQPMPFALLKPILIMKPPAGKEILRVPMNNGGGEYSFTLPDPSLPSTQIQKVCNKIGKAVDKICLTYSFSPTAVSILVKTLVAEQFPNAPDKESITKVSDKVTKIIPQLCMIKDEVNIADFCELVGEIYLNPNPDQYTYTLVAFGSGKMTEIPLGNFDPNTGGTITYDIPGEFNVWEFRTDPRDPAPLEGYTAIAEIECASPQGTEVTISIVGSDGYTNSQTSTVTANGQVTLYVPGGAQSVKDVLTVTANGMSWSTYIVF